MGIVTKKIIFPILFSIFCFNTYAGTCSSISRTNASANSVLTSTRYNADLNTAYTAINALDGGCVTDGTLEDGALNTTDFAVLLNGITQGCKVSFSDTNTLSVDRCIASVNGNFIKTTSANTVTWNCSGCTAEAASTTYYLYIKTGSSGTTLNLLISTTAPNGDGYDNSGNKVLASFYNNAAQDIQTTSIRNYYSYGVNNDHFRTTGTAVVSPRIFFVDVNCDASSLLAGETFEGTPTIGNISSGTCTLTVPADNFTSTIGKVVCFGTPTTTATDEFISFGYASLTSITIQCTSSSGGACTQFNVRMGCFTGLN